MLQMVKAAPFCLWQPDKQRSSKYFSMSQYARKRSNTVKCSYPAADESKGSEMEKRTSKLDLHREVPCIPSSERGFQWVPHIFGYSRTSINSWCHFAGPAEPKAPPTMQRRKPPSPANWKASGCEAEGFRGWGVISSEFVSGPWKWPGS